MLWLSEVCHRDGVRWVTQWPWHFGVPLGLSTGSHIFSTSSTHLKGGRNGWRNPLSDPGLKDLPPKCATTGWGKGTQIPRLPRTSVHVQLPLSAFSALRHFPPFARSSATARQGEPRLLGWGVRGLGAAEGTHWLRLGGPGAGRRFLKGCAGRRVCGAGRVLPFRGAGGCVRAGLPGEMSEVGERPLGAGDGRVRGSPAALRKWEGGWDGGVCGCGRRWALVLS